MKFVIVLLLSALAFINAYDFEDHAYNELLVEQYSLAHPRLRRAAENNCIDSRSCCYNDAVPQYHANETEECSKELGFDRSQIRGPLTDAQINQIKCLAECISKKKGHFDADGNLLKDELLKDIRKPLEQVAWLKPKVEDIFNKCLDGLPTKVPENQCNDIGMTIGHCIWKEIQLECPKDRQANLEKCEALQVYLKENKAFPPPPPIRC
uniref:OBP14 n=1 Tax=Holotrichia parallela TaxID=93412 RepID=A0A0G2YD86_HOLPA|nr:OBP14 [Holotrichia parallela]